MSLGLSAGSECDTVSVRCSHSDAVLWSANRSSVVKVLRGKRTLRLEKTEGCAELTQAFVVEETSRKESLDGRERKERRCVAEYAGE